MREMNEVKVWRDGQLVTLTARREVKVLKLDVAGAVLTDVKDLQRWRVKCSCNHGRGVVVLSKMWRRRHLVRRHGIVDRGEQDRILGVKRSVGARVDLSRRARLSWIKIWLKKGRGDKAKALAEELGVEMVA